jgi:hypothetical protein
MGLLQISQIKVRLASNHDSIPDISENWGGVWLI